MIAAGCCHALCLTDDGELYAWGTGDKGQLGLGPTITECTTPHPVVLRSICDCRSLLLDRLPL